LPFLFFIGARLVFVFEGSSNFTLTPHFGLKVNLPIPPNGFPHPRIFTCRNAIPKVSKNSTTSIECFILEQNHGGGIW